MISPVLIAAHAQSMAEGTDQARIAIYPKGQDDGTRFEATAEPGETIEFTAMLVNHGEKPIELLAYSANVVPAVNGGMQIATPDDPPVAHSIWMSFDNIEFTLQPGETLEHPFTVAVPPGTPPGQYVNAVALETAEPLQTTGGSQAFEQYFRKVVSVYVVVPGDEVSDFGIGTPEIAVLRGNSNLLVPIENIGNVRVDLKADVTLRDQAGTVIYSGETFFGPVYMGQTTLFQIPIGSAPEPGDYVLNLDLQERNGEARHTLEDQEIVVPEDSDPQTGAPYSISEIEIIPNGDPIVFANVSMDISALQNPIRSGRLTLSVHHNDQFLEDFVLADNLSVSSGSTVSVNQRYLPLSSWEPGVYTFSLKLESVDGASSTLLLELEDVATFEVP